MSDNDRTARYIAILIGETFLQIAIPFFISIMSFNMIIIIIINFIIFVSGITLTIWGLQR